MTFKSINSQGIPLTVKDFISASRGKPKKRNALDILWERFHGNPNAAREICEENRATQLTDEEIISKTLDKISKDFMKNASKVNYDSYSCDKTYKYEKKTFDSLANTIEKMYKEDYKIKKY